MSEKLVKKLRLAKRPTIIQIPDLLFLGCAFLSLELGSFLPLIGLYLFANINRIEDKKYDFPIIILQLQNP